MQLLHTDLESIAYKDYLHGICTTQTGPRLDMNFIIEDRTQAGADHLPARRCHVGFPSGGRGRWKAKLGPTVDERGYDFR